MQRLLKHSLGFPLIYAMQRRDTLLTVARGIADTEQADREAQGSHDFGLSAVYAFEALLDHFLLAAGRVRPPALDLLPLSDVASAHDRLQHGHARRKQVLQVAG